MSVPEKIKYTINEDGDERVANWGGYFIRKFEWVDSRRGTHGASYVVMNSGSDESASFRTLRGARDYIEAAADRVRYPKAF